MHSTGCGYQQDETELLIAGGQPWLASEITCFSSCEQRSVYVCACILACVFMYVCVCVHVCVCVWVGGWVGGCGCVCTDVLLAYFPLFDAFFLPRPFLPLA